MYSSIIGTTEDRGSIEIDTDPGNLLCGNCCNRSRPLARQKYARASIPKICQSLNSQPIVSSFRQQRPLSIYLCSFLLDGRTREQREKEIPPTSLPPLLLTSSTNQQKPLSLSLCCHRGAAVRRPMDRFMVGAASLPSPSPSHHTRRPNFMLL